MKKIITYAIPLCALAGFSIARLICLLEARTKKCNLDLTTRICVPPAISQCSAFNQTYYFIAGFVILYSAVWLIRFVYLKLTHKK